MTRWRVGNVKNNHASLIGPVTAMSLSSWLIAAAFVLLMLVDCAAGRDRHRPQLLRTTTARTYEACSRRDVGATCVEPDFARLPLDRPIFHRHAEWSSIGGLSGPTAPASSRSARNADGAASIGIRARRIIVLARCMTVSSPGRITSATTSTSDCWALLRGSEQYRDRKFLERFGGAGALAAGKFS
jgi:hypothetical protein